MRSEYGFEFAGRHHSSDTHGAGFLPGLRRLAEPQVAGGGGRMLEWGAGLSTLLLSDLAATHGGHLVSLDHNAEYQQAVRRQVSHPGSVTAYTLELTGPTRGQADQGLNYATFPLLLDTEFDFILIDGRRRVECAVVAALLCHERSIVVMHDYRRRRYQVVRALYDLVEDTDQFRVMRPRAELLDRRREVGAHYGWTESPGGVQRPSRPDGRAERGADRVPPPPSRDAGPAGAADDSTAPRASSGGTAVRRVLFASHHCYLDDSNGAAVSSRDLMQALAGQGVAVEVLSGAMLDLKQEVEPAAWLADRGFAFEEAGGHARLVDARGVRDDDPPHFRLTVRGVPVTLHRGPTTRPHEPDDDECRSFLRLFEATIGRFRPEVVVGYGGGRLRRAVFARARAWGAATVFNLHNFQYTRADSFADVDVIRVPSRFAADHYRETLGLQCHALTNPIDVDRVRVERPEPKYVTFVNPAREKGVYAFARIADELGRRRPDVRLLVVEARGAEATLAGCGLDLPARGNVFLMAHTPDPRRFYRVSRLVLMPSLWRESLGRVAVEAMVNGIPVVASDRGALPETLGAAGIVLPLPDRLTPGSRSPPTAEEVGPWVEAIIRLWDDRPFLERHRALAHAEARRWAPEVLGPRYARFFEEVARRRPPRGRGPRDPAGPAPPNRPPADFV